MAIDLVPRARWGARAPRGSYDSLRSTRGVKVHYTGGHVDPRIADDHDRCAAVVRQIQRNHMDGNGWLDIGYSMAVCPHGQVFVGRGPGRVPAANGPGLNSGHYAVLGLVGNAGLTQPPDAMLHGICDAIDYLRAEGGAGREVKGHRDGYATDCPGEPLYAWVRRGAPRPGGGRPTPARETTWMEAVMDELPLLRKGCEKDAKLRSHIKTANKLLDARGYTVGGGVDDTTFGEPMVKQVKALQKAKGVPVDGVIGPKTWPKLILP